jgi:hypothetical protein
MGADIHMYAEKYNKEKNQWVKIGDVFNNKYYWPEQEIDKYNQPMTDQPYQGRNYDLFAILADVRNGYGFAGCDTGDGFIPISEPKGLPEDVSPEIQEESDSWDGDGHSHSYLTVKEVMEYDWSQTTKHRCFVQIDDYIEMLRKGENIPESACGMVSGGKVEHITEEQFRNNDFDSNNPYVYVRYEYEETYRESIGDFFFENTINELKKLGDPKEIRMVFWFDN